MEPTLIIAVAAVVLGLLLLMACAGIGVVAVVVVMRRRRARPAAPPKVEKAPATTAERKLPKPPIAAAPSATPVPPPSAPPPPPQGLGAGGLIGFFDEGSNDSAKTELFQRGANAYEFPDDEDPLEEGEATEIFSAHGAAGDLAEFAFDHDDPSGTPRYPDRK